jgi:hypothetical protein
MTTTPMSDIRKSVLEIFEKVGKAQNEQIFDTFKAPSGILLEMPLIYNYVTKKNQNNIVEETINLRNSKFAFAGRPHLSQIRVIS